MALARGLSTDLLEKGCLLGHRRSNSGGRLLESGEYLVPGRQEQRDGRSNGTAASATGCKSALLGPSRLSRSSQVPVTKDGTLRRTVALVALSVLATTVLLLLGLLTLAAAGPGAASRLTGRDLTTPERKRSEFAHYLAEGLASMASTLDPDAVEEFAPPRGYIRKALVESRGRLSAREEEAMRLQAYYDSEIARLHQDFDQQREAYDLKVRQQQALLEEVFGEDDVPEQNVQNQVSDL